jgi:hypothetical protein
MKQIDEEDEFYIGSNDELEDKELVVKLERHSTVQYQLNYVSNKEKTKLAESFKKDNYEEDKGNLSHDTEKEEGNNVCIHVSVCLY